MTTEEDAWTHDQTTMFFNKYCENPNIPTVANRVAEIIVDYETNSNIQLENEVDFEIEDEIISEEEFLKNVDEHLDEKVSDWQHHPD